MCAFHALLCGGAAASQKIEVSEAQIKAALLYNFSRYIKWPADFRPGPEDAVVFGVVGDEAFAEVLRKTLGSKTVGGKRILVRDYPQSSISPSHLLYIAAKDPAVAKSALASSKGPSLLVGNGARFLDEGGMIAFVMKEEKVRFEIDARKATSAGLQISTDLLKLADRVRR